MSQTTRTKSQQQRDQAVARRDANAYGMKRKPHSPVDLRGQLLHDGSREKRDIPYREYLLSKHWRIVRNKAVALADNRCSACGSKARICVHHITYDNLWHEYANDVTVLCDTCHNMLHGQYIHPT